MLFCSSVATVGSAIATVSTGAERCSRKRWAQATINPANNAENTAIEINCLAETLYIINSSFDSIITVRSYSGHVHGTSIMLVETPGFIQLRTSDWRDRLKRHARAGCGELVTLRSLDSHLGKP